MEGESNIYGSEFAEAVISNPGGATRTIRFETGRLAKQAAGSVTVYQGDTLILSAATASKRPKDNLDFFPLTVDVEERMYAAGKIPGSFFRREGRPSEDAILTCRLTDRPLRPSFKKGLRNEIQIVSTVLSLDPDHLYDVLAINSAACAVLLSGLPFTGPVGATRVACINGEWVAFPTHTELEDATFDRCKASNYRFHNISRVDKCGRRSVVYNGYSADIARIRRSGRSAPAASSANAKARSLSRLRS